ncbi:MAG TPA: lipopolysaccharide biosynthesis protein [Acidimicrobiia bacterium]|nr:lipopolysaccharide biosynthesis protein [Acidimicrobiia bacterium]
MALTDDRASDAADTAELGTTAARAVLWNYASFAAGKVLVLVTMAVLARLLTPEDFGIVGYATLVVAYLAVLKDLGLGAALIQRRDEVEGSAETVYVANLILGAFLTTVVALSAPLVAGFFREPLVTPLLRVLSFTFILEALGSVQLVLLRRNMDFRRKMIPDVGRSIVKGVVSIVAAATGFGVWALVWGQLAGVLASVILSWTVLPWRPRLRIHRHLLPSLMRFGAPLIITDIQYAIWANLDYVVVGRLLGDAALGVYTLAYRLPELLIQSVWRVLAQAVFPFFSSIQEDMALLRKGFLATIRYTQVVIVPLCFGLFIAADPAVGALFGDQWSAAVPVLRLMAVFSLVGSIGVNAGDVYKALGRSDVLAKLSVLELIALVPALIFGAHHGIVGVAWAHAIVAALDTSVRLLVATRMVGTTAGEIWRQMRPSLAAGGWLAATAVPALWLTRGMPDPVRLLAAAWAGGLAYLIAMWRYDPVVIKRMAGWLGLRRKVAA